MCRHPGFLRQYPLITIHDEQYIVDAHTNSRVNRDKSSTTGWDGSMASQPITYMAICTSAAWLSTLTAGLRSSWRLTSTDTHQSLIDPSLLSWEANIDPSL
jgi:hypothetical protein